MEEEWKFVTIGNQRYRMDGKDFRRRRCAYSQPPSELAHQQEPRPPPPLAGRQGGRWMLNIGRGVVLEAWRYGKLNWNLNENWYGTGNRPGNGKGLNIKHVFDHHHHIF